MSQRFKRGFFGDNVNSRLKVRDCAADFDQNEQHAIKTLKRKLLSHPFVNIQSTARASITIVLF